MANNKLGDVSTDIFFHHGCVVLWTNNSHSFLSYDDKVQAYVALWHVHLPLWVHRLPHGHFPTSCIFRCGCCQNYCTRCFCVSNHLYLSPRLPFLHILYKCMEEWLTEVSRHVICNCLGIILILYFEFFLSFVHFPQDTWTHRMNLWLPEGKVVGERDSLRVWGGHVHCAMFKMDNQQGPTV